MKTFLILSGKSALCLIVPAICFPVVVFSIPYIYCSGIRGSVATSLVRDRGHLIQLEMV